MSCRDTLILFLFLIIFLSDCVGFYLECNGGSGVLATDPDEVEMPVNIHIGMLV